MAKAIYP